jgi:mannose/fructose/N-acetylgalactosamine-specific phosphotransferase system component IIB
VEEARVPVELFRVDDRLVHGQVVVGWAKPMNAGFIIVVDDALAASEWEQDLYRLAVPPDVEIFFANVSDGAKQLAQLAQEPRRGILLTGDIATMVRLHQASPTFSEVNLGGVHTGPGRIAYSRYVYLSADEESHLRGLAGRGVQVTAQDLPVSRQIPLEELLDGRRDT